MGRGAKRSYARITDDELRRLAEIARADLADFIARQERGYLADRLLCIALAQGAALHFVDGVNGVKDFDVYLFFAKSREKDFPPRRTMQRDFGPSRHGKGAANNKFEGRRVDVLGRSIPHAVGSSAIASVRAYLAARRSETAKHLARKAVVMLAPSRWRGRVIWPVAAS